MAKERFINRQAGKNAGRIAYVARRDEEAKTVLLVYEDSADGKEGSKVSYSTLKRWWKKVQDEVEQPVEDDTAGDGTPYTEVMNEIINDGKEAIKQVKAKETKVSASKPKKEKKEKVPAADYDDCLEKVQAVVDSVGYSIKACEKLPRMLAVVGSNGKQRYAIYLGAKKCVVSMPESRIPEGMVPDRKRNCPMAAAFDVAYDSLNTLKSLITKEEK